MESIRQFEIPKEALEQHKFDARVLARALHEENLPWPTTALFYPPTTIYWWHGHQGHQVTVDCTRADRHLILAYTPTFFYPVTGTGVVHGITEQQRITLPEQGWSDIVVSYLKGIEWTRLVLSQPVEAAKEKRITFHELRIPAEASHKQLSRFATLAYKASLSEEIVAAPDPTSPPTRVRSVQEEADIAMRIGMLPATKIEDFKVSIDSLRPLPLPPPLA